MERVSFKTARVIKEVGYPQGDKNSGLIYVYALEDHDDNFVPYTRIGKLTTNYHCQTFRVLSDIHFVVAPTYLEAWIWLCDHISYIGKRKLLSISIFKGRNKWELSFNCERLDSDDDDCNYEFMGNTQEEVIIKAIEYLADNDLIK